MSDVFLFRMFDEPELGHEQQAREHYEQKDTATLFTKTEATKTAPVLLRLFLLLLLLMLVVVVVVRASSSSSRLVLQ